MDPGNWASDIAGGARFGYTLLSVIMLSNLMAILLQALSARLGIASGRDLAQACRDAYSAARDDRPLAALRDRHRRLRPRRSPRRGHRAQPALRDPAALRRLSHRRSTCSSSCRCSTGASAMSRHWSSLLILGIAGLFCGGVVAGKATARPTWRAASVPTLEIARNPEMLYIAIGDPRRDGDAAQPLSALIHRADAEATRTPTRAAADAIRFATIDSTIALMSALFINAAILIVAAGVFHGTGYDQIADIGDALQDTHAAARHDAAASTLFAVALLLSGPELDFDGHACRPDRHGGFLSIRLRPWLRRLVTRLIAIIPAIVVLVIYGDAGTGPLLHPEPGDPEFCSCPSPCSRSSRSPEIGRRWASSWHPSDARHRLADRVLHRRAQRLDALADDDRRHIGPRDVYAISSFRSSTRTPIRRS